MKPRKQSSKVFDGPNRIAHRALIKSARVRPHDLEKPLVAVVNSWNEINPGHVMLRALADGVKKGVRRAGGTPLEFNTIAVCDGIAMMHGGMRFSLPSREIVAASTEIMIKAHGFDAMVMLGSCDKIIPGMLMAALRIDIPSILLNGGPMEAGSLEG